MNLGACHQGDRVTICKVRGTGMIRKRLLEMGFLRGAQIHIVKYAPLRDPMEVVVNGSHISLRVGEASCVEVELNEFLESA